MYNFKLAPTNTVKKKTDVRNLGCYILKQKYINRKFSTKIKWKAETSEVSMKNWYKTERNNYYFITLPKTIRKKLFLRHWMPAILKAKNTCSKKIKCRSDLHKWTDKQKSMELNGTSREQLLLIVLDFIINCKKSFTGFESALLHFWAPLWHLLS